MKHGRRRREGDKSAAREREKGAGIASNSAKQLRRLFGGLFGLFPNHLTPPWEMGTAASIRSLLSDVQKKNEGELIFHCPFSSKLKVRQDRMA